MRVRLTETITGKTLEMDIQCDLNAEEILFTEAEAFKVIEFWETASPDLVRSSYDLRDDGILVLADCDREYIEMGAWYIGDTDWPAEYFPFTTLTIEAAPSQDSPGTVTEREETR